MSIKLVTVFMMYYGHLLCTESVNNVYGLVEITLFYCICELPED